MSGKSEENELVKRLSSKCIPISIKATKAKGGGFIARQERIANKTTTTKKNANGYSLKQKKRDK